MSFFVLWIFIEAGSNAQAIATDHYDTLAECEAAKAAIIGLYEQNYFKPFNSDRINCIKAEVK